MYHFEILENGIDRINNLQELKKALEQSVHAIRRTMTKSSNAAEKQLLEIRHARIRESLSKIELEILQVSEQVTSVLPTFTPDNIKNGYIYRGTLLRRLNLAVIGGNEVNIRNLAVTPLEFGDLVSFTNPPGWGGQGPRAAFNYANGSADPTPNRIDKVIIEVPLETVIHVLQSINMGDHLAIPGSALRNIRGVRIYRAP